MGEKAKHGGHKRTIVVVAVLCAVLLGDAPAIAARYRFNAETRRWGADAKARTYGSYWTDYDRNGFPDLLLGRHLEESWLLSNDGDSFRRRGRRVLDRPIDRHGCAWGEANGDRRPDLYCTQGADMGTGAGPNQLLIYTGRRFRSRAREFGVRDRLGRGRSVDWLDHEGDGDLDLFVGNARRAEAPNVLFRKGSRRFRRADVGLSEVVFTVGSSWADWDRDGDPDVLVQRKGATTLAYENLGGTFQRTRLPGVTEGRWLSSTWGDLDADGWPDLHLVSFDTSRILQNQGGRLEIVAEHRLREGRSSAWIDVDNDGDQDLFVVQGAESADNGRLVNRRDLLIVRTRDGFRKLGRRSFRGPRVGSGESVAAADVDRDRRMDVFVTNGDATPGPTELLLNASASRTRSGVGIEVRGRRGNPLGFGSFVTVRAGGNTYRRYITDGMGFRAQSEVGYVHQGIGRSARALVQVRWANGRTDCARVKAGNRIRIVQGTQPCAAVGS